MMYERHKSDHECLLCRFIHLPLFNVRARDGCGSDCYPAAALLLSWLQHLASECPASFSVPQVLIGFPLELLGEDMLEALKESRCQHVSLANLRYFNCFAGSLFGSCSSGAACARRYSPVTHAGLLLTPYLAVRYFKVSVILRPCRSAVL